jgi:hypothetical protein
LSEHAAFVYVQRSALLFTATSQIVSSYSFGITTTQILVVAQQMLATFARAQKRAAGGAPVTSNASSSGAMATKPKINPVKIYELPDAIKIGEFGHLFARVRFWRGRPFVDIRRYRPDETRPNFFHPESGSVFLSQRQFEALLENGSTISNLLVQYGGGNALHDSADDNANDMGAQVDTDVVASKAARMSATTDGPKPARPPFHRQNGASEDEEAAEDTSLVDFIQAVTKQLNEKGVPNQQ